jgi:uncharacterized cupredoxin-like copper-binding protein
MDRTEVPPSETQRRWRMLEAVCLLAVSLSLFAVIALARQVIPPVLIFGTLYLALAALVFRMPADRWIAGVAGALAILGMLANAPFLAEDLAHLDSWGSFMPASVSVVAGIGAALAAFLSYRGGTASGVRPAAIGIATAGIALLALSGVLSATASNDEARAGDVTVVAEAVEYPETLRASTGRAGFLVENKDPFRHTFVIEGHDVKLEVPSNKARRIDVDLKPGRYTFLCDVPGHEIRTGTLTVQ